MKRTLEPIANWTIWDPVKGRSSTSIRPRMMTIHTAVTNSQDIYGPGLGPGRTHAHFYNPKSGTLRQHQDINRKAFADGGGNSYCVSVEHWDGYPNGAPGYWKHGSDVPPLTDSQIENDARLFAHLVTHFGVPNRIATPGNLSGLGWHRLGVKGNFGAYNPNDRKTWSRAQSGANFSNATGKSCPGDRRIDQIQEIYDRAQEYLTPKEPTPEPKPVEKEGWLMALTDKQQTELYNWVREIHRELDPDRQNSVANKVWKTNHAAGRIDAASRVQTEALSVLANGFNIDPGVLVEKIEEAINSIEVTLTAKGDKDA